MRSEDWELARRDLDRMHSERELRPVTIAVFEEPSWPVALLGPRPEPMAMRLQGCEADWVGDVRPRRRHEHRQRS